jgi:hypothetical protein
VLDPGRQSALGEHGLAEMWNAAADSGARSRRVRLRSRVTAG